jgi:hypothetical protein
MLLLLACHPRVAEPPAPEVPTAAALVEAFNLARGAEELNGRSSVLIEGVIKTDDGEALYTENITSERQYRMDTKVRGRALVIACDGISGWVWSGVQPTAMTPNEQRAACAAMNLWAPLEGDTEVSTARLGGQDVWAVSFEQAGQPTRTVWFDQDTSFIVGRSWRVDSVDVVEHQLDWQDYEGVWLPSTVVDVPGGRTFEKRSVTWGPEELPEFQMPDAY